MLGVQLQLPIRQFKLCGFERSRFRYWPIERRNRCFRRGFPFLRGRERRGEMLGNKQRLPIGRRYDHGKERARRRRKSDFVNIRNQRLIGGNVRYHHVVRSQMLERIRGQWNHREPIRSGGRYRNDFLSIENSSRQ